MAHLKHTLLKSQAALIIILLSIPGQLIQSKKLVVPRLPRILSDTGPYSSQTCFLLSTIFLRPGAWLDRMTPAFPCQAHLLCWYQELTVRTAQAQQAASYNSTPHPQRREQGQPASLEGFGLNWQGSNKQKRFTGFPWRHKLDTGLLPKAG